MYLARAVPDVNESMASFVPARTVGKRPRFLTRTMRQPSGRRLAPPEPSYSAGMDRLLVVVLLVPDGHPPVGYGMSPRRGRRIAACVAYPEGKGARMADKEILARIAAAVEDAEATSD